MKRRVVRAAVIGGAVVWAVDLAYRAVGDISYLNRERCVLYRVLPRLGRILLENFVETVLMVLVGAFVAVLLARWFVRFRRFLPGNPVSAFLAGSLLPICACAVIPLVASLKGKMRFPTTIAFVLAAPLLSPYIIILSFSVLGIRYGILRILSSFVVVMVASTVLGLLSRRNPSFAVLPTGHGCSRACAEEDVYVQTYDLFRKMLPFLLIGGAISVALEYLAPKELLSHGPLGSGLYGVGLWTLVGIPLYFCNGAEVLFLRPLMSHGFPVGTGIAFSLTSTAVCATSIAMLLHTLGTRLTTVLLLCLLGVSLGLGLTLNAVF